MGVKGGPPRSIIFVCSSCGCIIESVEGAKKYRSKRLLLATECPSCGRRLGKPAVVIFERRGVVARWTNQYWSG